MAIRDDSGRMNIMAYSMVDLEEGLVLV